MPLRSPEEAKTIYQDLLDRINACYDSCDFSSYLNMIHVPHHIRTTDSSFVLREESELRTMFDEFIKQMKKSGADTFKRECTSARFKGAHRIEGEHMTHMMRAGKYVQPASHARSMLMKVGANWMVCASQNRMNKNTLASLALQAAKTNTSGSTDPSNAPDGEETEL